MKKKIIQFIVSLGIFSSIIALIIGIWLATNDGILMFLYGFVVAIAVLIVTGILYVFLTCMCEIVDNLREMNGHPPEDCDAIVEKKTYTKNKSKHHFED